MVIAVAVVVTLALLGVGAAIAWSFVRRARASGAAATNEAVAGAQIVRQVDVNSFGRESAGMAQVRGNGTLTLTGAELVFVLWAPTRTLRIPIGEILEVDTTRSHLGKSRMADLLWVRWRAEDGSQDTIAFQVDDLADWFTALGAAPG